MNFGLIIMLVLLHCKGATTESTRKILAGMDVTLDCPFNKPDHVPLMKVTVEWGVMVDEHAVQRLVYTFQDERPMVHRVGSWVDAKSLLQGNASLHLLNVSVADEGVYCCRVIITPNTYKVSTRLEVSAKPVISLPEAVTVMEGEKRTLMCEITGFYPEQLTVTWLIQNGSQLSRGVCTGMATPNPDGTYSVSSLITVQATATESSGVVYVCHVTHRSHPGYHSKGVLLTVQ
uniref:Ig-like domain-containing protein n=1 Tax=Esox lucius TaxID=8010 RepID=A0AAY5K1J0_ESOLU